MLARRAGIGFNSGSEFGLILGPFWIFLGLFKPNFVNFS